VQSRVCRRVSCFLLASSFALFKIFTKGFSADKTVLCKYYLPIHEPAGDDKFFDGINSFFFQQPVRSFTTLRVFDDPVGTDHSLSETPV